jgi:ribosomal protein L16 Arg81 hydroxylase
MHNLTSLLASFPEQSFIEHFLEKRRFHASCGGGERVARLLPWSTINQLVESDILPADRLKIVRASVEIAPVMFRRQDGSSRLRAGQLQALLSQGASLVINNIDDLVAELGTLTAALERRLGDFVAMNAYLSFGRAGAFKPHWDTHDVLVLQVHGSKRWRSYGTPVPYPIDHCAPSELPTEVVWEDILVPGDLLYLPRGEVHDALVDEQNSVHLTIRIVPRRGLDFVDWLTQKLAQDEFFRMDLTRLCGAAALSQHEALLKKRLHTLIDASNLSEFFESDDRERQPRPMLSLGYQDELLGEDTLILPAPRRNTPLLTEDEDVAVVIIGGEQHRLSAEARRALSLLISQNGMKFRNLAAALRTTSSDEKLRRALAELIKRGLVSLDSSESLQ